MKKLGSLQQQILKKKYMDRLKEIKFIKKGKTNDQIKDI